jgi:hypothetical protein
MAYQSDWKWCRLCQSLCFAGSGKEACAGNTGGNGKHDFAGSGQYFVMLLPEAGFPGQSSWQYCQKCSQLCFTGGAIGGNCAGGGSHDFSKSGNYAVGGGQSNWQWCDQCQTMAFAGNPSLGACPGPGPSKTHVHTGSGNYTLLT